MAGSLVTRRLKIDPIASLAAVTRNAACGLNNQTQPQGVIAVGAKANFIELKSTMIESWCQSPGHSPIEKTWIID